MLSRLLAAILVAAPAFASATQGGPIPVPLPLFPSNNWWNVDVSAAPVDPASNSFIQFIGTTRGMHPDFGGDAGNGDVYGMPYIIVDGAQAKKIVDFVEYPDESDGVNHDTGEPFAFYPIPDEAITQNGWIEGGQPGNVAQDGDRHMLIVDKDNNTLYELYHVFHNGSGWEAGSGAFFDMKTNNRRPEGWTSADAAGLAILPGLVRYDEVFGDDEIRHAFRVTVRATNGHVFPASHTAGSTSGALPMGARLRLKESTDISGFTPEVQKIFRAMKRYGLIVADNGSDMYVSGVYDTRWNNDVLNPAFRAVKAGDFEVVQLGWHPAVTFVLTLPDVMGAGDAATATLTAYDANYNVATGYTGTVHFTSTDGAATLPPDFTFTPADAGTHTFPSGFTLRTAGLQTVTVTDTVNATITLVRGIRVGPATPVALSAQATGVTQVTVAWNASPTATEYEVSRATSPGGFGAPVLVAGTNYVDNTVAAGTTYLYKVRAVDAAGSRSPYTAPDVATTVMFTNDPLVAGVTTVEDAHVLELRQAASAMRSAAGLGAATFTDAALAGVAVKAVHVQELRNAIGEARAALGLAAIAFTDATLAAGSTQVKAAHLQELRTGVR